MSLPRMKDVARGSLTPKERKISEKKEVLGVCLIGKRTSSGSFRAVCSGSVVRGLLEYDGCSEKVFIITSDHIVLKEDLGELQSGSKALNTGDYRLYFKIWDSANKLKIYELDKVTNSKDKVQFISGLAIIALDAKKLRKRSGILSYRPFTANKEATECLGGSVCQIVDGNTDAFAVTPYDLEYIKESGKYVLKLPEKRVIIKTWSELTGKGAYNLHPCGAVILRSGGAVGVLMFVDDKISPVLLSQLQPFGAVGTRVNQGEIVAERSEVDPDVFSSSSGLLMVDLDHVKESPTASSRNSSLAEGTGELGNDDTIPGRRSEVQPKPYDYKFNEATENEEDETPTETSLVDKLSPHKGADDSENKDVETNAVLDHDRSPSRVARNAIKNTNESSAYRSSLHGKSLPVVTGRRPHKHDNVTEYEKTISARRSAVDHKASCGDKERNLNNLGADESANKDQIPVGASAMDYKGTSTGAIPKRIGIAGAPQYGPSPSEAPSAREDTVPKFVNHIADCYGNIVIGDNVNANIGVNSSTDAATQHGPVPEEVPGAVAPISEAPQYGPMPSEAPRVAAATPSARDDTVPKFVNNIADCDGNIVIGDNVHANIGVNSSTDAAPQSGPVPEEAPGAAAPRPNGAPQYGPMPSEAPSAREDTVPKFENNIADYYGNIVIGDNVNANIGVNSSTDAAPRRRPVPEEAPGAAAPRPSVQNRNSSGRPKFINNIRGGSGTTVIGDNVSLNIGCSSRRFDPFKSSTASNFFSIFPLMVEVYGTLEAFLQVSFLKTASAKNQLSCITSSLTTKTHITGAFLWRHEHPFLRLTRLFGAACDLHL